ncbi:plasmid SOS inhibition protein [Serratia plymuthica A30]|uniref:conjugation system SOS inhibitor PsiB n=1 Tax=Serratia plymuthica TaxID=82996 RepID=UPI0002A4603D|nr:conjugation system SOS inhibitor PsiB [Serratia plymuthica]EKF67036.1 plasmid SOS inhibition protein [Serratia plymuthica A30]
MKNQKLSLEQLTAMGAIELEQYRDRGREWRRVLNNVVLSELALPEGWVANAEEACEFCGQVPVVCRINPKDDERTAIFLCSAGTDVPGWSAVLPYQGTALSANQGDCLAWLHTADNFEPEVVNQVLKNVSEYYRHGFTRPEQLVAALRMGGLCV